MLRHPGNYLGDAWFHVEGNVAHCYYLTCPDSVERHTAWDIGHATSLDLVNWKVEALALPKGNVGEWDDECLATGSIIRFNGRFWMGYTTKWNKPGVAIGLAVSDDLHHWTKVSYNPITQVDQRYYEREGSAFRAITHWRDPHLFVHEGKAYHFVCASRNNGPYDRRGVVGVAVSQDMVNWETLAPPKFSAVLQELECPQIYEEENHVVFFFSSYYELFCTEYQRKYGKKYLTNSMYCMVGPTKFGPFEMIDPSPLVPQNAEVQPYAAQVVRWKGKIVMLGTVWDDHGDYITDPMELVNTPSGYRLKP